MLVSTKFSLKRIEQETYTLAAIFSFGVGTIFFVIVQHKAPEQFRPLTIVRRLIWGSAGAVSRWKSAGRQRREERSGTNKTFTEFHPDWGPPPCDNCGYEGDFRTEMKTDERSAGTVLIEALVIIFIVAPLTFGFGILLLLALLVRQKKAFPVDLCPNCGVSRSL